MRVRSNGATQTTPLILVLMGLVACALAERFGYRDLVTIAVATNAAGLALLTQNRMGMARKGERTEPGPATK